MLASNKGTMATTSTFSPRICHAEDRHPSDGNAAGAGDSARERLDAGLTGREVGDDVEKGGCGRGRRTGDVTRGRWRQVILDGWCTRLSNNGVQHCGGAVRKLRMVVDQGLFHWRALRGAGGIALCFVRIDVTVRIGRRLLDVRAAIPFCVPDGGTTVSVVALPQATLRFESGVGSSASTREVDDSV